MYIEFGKPYVLKNKRFQYKAGTICYRFGGATYGLVSDDNNHTGIEHEAMTLDPEGMGHPFFTVPVHDLEEVQQ